MKLLWTLFLTAFLLVMTNVSRAEFDLSPLEANERVASGQAVLVDVREPEEWAEGVAQPATLLSLSELNGDRKNWKGFLEANKDRQIIVYCRSGKRSGAAAKTLAAEGFKTLNVGGYAQWADAGLPTRKP